MEIMKSLLKKIIPSFAIGAYHYLLALAGAFLYGFPSRKLKVIGVTGTSGKSTTVDFISRILEEAGLKTASLSSVRFRIDGKERENKLKMTMPGRLKIQKFLRQAVNEGCKYAVLEITSEGIKQHRHKFINFKTAVFTNLSPEHIESHGGFEKYRKAKMELFKAAKNVHIINLDDKNSKYFLQFTAKEKYCFSTDTPNKSHGNYLAYRIFWAENCQTFPQGLKFSVNKTEFNLKLLGRFNISNALAAICVGLSEGISLKTCKKALQKAKGIPGRMEMVAKEPFAIIVDYAHTPEQLEQVYKTLAGQLAEKSSGKLVCVLGSCGGGRDKWKRPVLGKLAGQYCKEIIVTNEDPYDEDPMEIINQVADGAAQKSEKILDRRLAIGRALKLANPGDIVVITGKGSEPWMCVANGKKIPWDDRKIARQLLIKIK